MIGSRLEYFFVLVTSIYLQEVDSQSVVKLTPKPLGAFYTGFDFKNIKPQT